MERAFQELVDGDIRHSLLQEPGVDLTSTAAPNDWAVHAVSALELRGKLRDAIAKSRSLRRRQTPCLWPRPSRASPQLLVHSRVCPGLPRTLPKVLSLRALFPQSSQLPCFVVVYALSGVLICQPI